MKKKKSGQHCLNLACYVFQRDSVLAIIPTACSAKLQPLHQGIKAKFRVSSVHGRKNPSLIFTVCETVCPLNEWSGDADTLTVPYSSSGLYTHSRKIKAIISRN
jgi:hypothetical protein